MVLGPAPLNLLSYLTGVKPLCGFTGGDIQLGRTCPPVFLPAVLLAGWWISSGRSLAKNFSLKYATTMNIM